MKNVTITLEDELMALARIKAAEAGLSLSAFVSRLLAERVQQNAAQQLAAMADFIDGPGLPGAAAAWPGREALHDEDEGELFHRHEHSDVRSRPQRPAQATHRSGFAEADHQPELSGAQPAKSE